MHLKERYTTDKNGFTYVWVATEIGSSYDGVILRDGNLVSRVNRISAKSFADLLNNHEQKLWSLHDEQVKSLSLRHEKNSDKQFEYKESGWIIALQACGGLSVIVAFMTAIKNKNAGEAILLESSVFIASALSCFFMAHVIKILTQIRDNTRFLLIETREQNRIQSK